MWLNTWKKKIGKRKGIKELSDKVLTLTSENFAQEVIQADLPVLVDFWAPWCGPCKMIGPIVEELAGELTGKMKVGKVNVDENQPLAGQYQVMSIPTLIVFQGGKPIKTLMGYQPKEALMETLGVFVK